MEGTAGEETIEGVGVMGKTQRYQPGKVRHASRRRSFRTVNGEMSEREAREEFINRPRVKWQDEEEMDHATGKDSSE